MAVIRCDTCDRFVDIDWEEITTTKDGIERCMNCAEPEEEPS